MTTVDEAREAAIEYIFDGIEADSRAMVTEGIDALIAAVRAEAYEKGRAEFQGLDYDVGFRDGRAESAQELAALREAAVELADATGAYLDTSRSPSQWATDRSRLWVAAENVRAIAATPAEEERT